MNARKILAAIVETTRRPVIHVSVDSDERPHGWWEQELSGEDPTSFLLRLPEIKGGIRRLTRNIRRALGADFGQINVVVGKLSDTSTGGGMASHSIDVAIYGPEELLMRLYKDQNFAMEWIGDVLSDEELAEIQAEWNPTPLQIDPDPIRH